MHRQTDRNKLITITLSYRRALTTLIETSKDINMVDWKMDVMFSCKASSDPSTPVTVKWYFDDVEIDELFYTRVVC